ncbi:MAG: hypothetical protein WBV69_12260 [Candidatus Sulfotelmatobacter sp.]
MGKSIALQMFVAAEKITAQHALAIGLFDGIVADPVAEALHRIQIRTSITQAPPL